LSTLCNYSRNSYDAIAQENNKLEKRSRFYYFCIARNLLVCSQANKQVYHSYVYCPSSWTGQS